MEYESIKSLEELMAIKPNGYYRLDGDIDCRGQVVSKISGDFTGIIDGNAHKISNLVLRASALICDAQPLALFYTMHRAIVKNIDISDLKIELPKTVYDINVAALCADASNSVFENVSVSVIDTLGEKIPLVYDSNDCKYKNVKLSSNMQMTKYE